MNDDLCYKCNNSLQSHIVKMIGDTFTCWSCNQGFPDKRELEIHIKIEHGQLVFGQSDWFGCRLCYNTLYCRRQDIVKHMRNAHQEEFIQAEDYLIKSAEDINLPCKECGEKVLLSRYCNTHRSLHPEPDEHTCHMCNVSYFDKNILQAHINLEHGKQVHNDPQFKCFMCKECLDQIYLGREDFYAHMHDTHEILLDKDSEQSYVVSSLKQILYSCKCCREPCLFSGFCRKHDADVSIDNCSEHPESHACEPCNVLYNDCNDLWIHLFSQHIDETLYCNLCDRSSDPIIIRAPSILMQHWKRCHRDEQLRTSCEIVLNGKTRYLCSQCSAIFSKFVQLKQHYVMHQSSNINYCDICKKNFKTRKSLGEHRRIVHNIHLESNVEDKVVACYRCPFCETEMKLFSSLKEHITSEHNNLNTDSTLAQEFICKICGLGFDLARKLRVHSSSAHASPSAGTFSASSDTRLVKSEVQVLEGDRVKYKCPVCDRTYTSFSETKRHFEIHSGEKKYSCSVCRKCFYIKNRLSEHYRRVHRLKVSMARTNDAKKSAEITVDGVTKFKCHVCDSIFKRYDSLRLHLRGHSGERPFTCDVCGKSFLAKKHLTRHYNCSHAGFGYQCNICGRVMSDHTNFKDHLDNHKGEKKYTCEICGTGFMYKSSLHHHKFSHSKERLFQCCYCEKKYQSPKTLKEHEQTHRVDVKHVCDTCGSEFNTRKNMLRHTKVHSTERPHVCEYCSVSFKEKKSLVRHYKVHMGLNTNPPLPTRLI